LGDRTANRDVCAFPGCARPCAPPPPTGGRSRYCDDPAHTPAAAYRARQRSGEARPARPRLPATDPAVAGAKDRRQLAGLHDRLRADLARIEETLAEIGQALAVTADVRALTDELLLAKERVDAAELAASDAEARADDVEAAVREQAAAAAARIEQTVRERDAARAEAAAATRLAADADQAARKAVQWADRVGSEVAAALARAEAAEAHAEALAHQLAGREPPDPDIAGEPGAERVEAALRELRTRTGLRPTTE
jgi:chromosome segregation ATPase